MKFNLLLLLLTTLTAVVLSQPHHPIIPGQTIIQLLDHDLYWGINGTGIVLYPGGIEAARWTIIPYVEGSFIKHYNDDRFVQYNGDFKQLTIEGGSGSLAQRWIFEPGPEGSVFICSSQDHNECATAVDEHRGWPRWVVKAEERSSTNPLQLWKLHTNRLD